MFITWPDGRNGVITRFLGSLGEAHRTASVLTDAHHAGLPVPQHDLAFDIDGDVLTVQELLPGTPPTKITPSMIDTIVALPDRFANLLDDRTDIPILPLCLNGSGDPYPRHELLASHNPRSRRLLDAVKAAGVNGPHTMIGTDLVHIDLTTSNILFDTAGCITGVVDWNLGAYRGDRHLALVKTRFELEWGLHSPDPDSAEVAAAAHLDQILGHRLPPGHPEVILGPSRAVPTPLRPSVRLTRGGRMAPPGRRGPVALAGHSPHCRRRTHPPQTVGPATRSRGTSSTALVIASGPSTGTSPKRERAAGVPFRDSLTGLLAIART